MPAVEVGEDQPLDEVARLVCDGLAPGDVVALRGPIGSGKTALVRACARELGVAEPVTSPTFALAHRYTGRVPVVHLDLYRLDQQPERDVADVAAEVGDSAVAFVEWPELGATWLPVPTRSVAITVLPDGTRRFALDAPA